MAKNRLRSSLKMNNEPEPEHQTGDDIEEELERDNEEDFSMFDIEED